MFNLPLAEGVTEKSFITALKGYSNIDDAMAHLDDEYIEYYLINMDKKSLKNALKKYNIHIKESIKESYEDPEITLGYAPQDGTIVKNIKYKGQYITLTYNKELGTWNPEIRFRSVMTALKYIKAQVNYNQSDV